MILVEIDTTLDLRTATQRPRDSAVLSKVDFIEILDTNNKISFIWNPFEPHGCKCFSVFRGNEKDSFCSRPGRMDWSHVTSVNWDFDGNILCSMRFIGIR